jgi:hypothetical protein
MRRGDICIYVSRSNRARLAALTHDRNTPSKVVWRAEIALATADGHGTNEIMRRRAGRSRACGAAAGRSIASGANFRGYIGDLARTGVLGEPDEELDRSSRSLKRRSCIGTAMRQPAGS